MTVSGNILGHVILDMIKNPSKLAHNLLAYLHSLVCEHRYQTSHVLVYVTLKSHGRAPADEHSGVACLRVVHFQHACKNQSVMHQVGP